MTEDLPPPYPPLSWLQAGWDSGAGRWARETAAILDRREAGEKRDDY